MQSADPLRPSRSASVALASKLTEKMRREGIVAGLMRDLDGVPRPSAYTVVALRHQQQQICHVRVAA